MGRVLPWMSLCAVLLLEGGLGVLSAFLVGGLWSLDGSRSPIVGGARAAIVSAAGLGATLAVVAVTGLVGAVLIRQAWAEPVPPAPEPP